MDRMVSETASAELTGRVIGLAMKVHSVLGNGFLESVYQRALAHEFRKAGLRYELEKAIQVHYDDEPVGDFFADFLVENVLIIELKAVQTLAVVHEVQTVNYLKATSIETGLLLNFGAERLEYRKKFRTPKSQR
jgi:GxxExxY protein